MCGFKGVFNVNQLSLRRLWLGCQHFGKILGRSCFVFLTTPCPINKGFLHLLCYESGPQKIPRPFGLPA